MKDIDFYNALSNPLSGLQDETVAALCELFMRVENLEVAKNTDHIPGVRNMVNTGRMDE